MARTKQSSRQSASSKKGAQAPKSHSPPYAKRAYAELKTFGKIRLASGKEVCRRMSSTAMKVMLSYIGGFWARLCRTSGSIARANGHTAVTRLDVASAAAHVLDADMGALARQAALCAVEGECEIPAPATLCGMKTGAEAARALDAVVMYVIAEVLGASCMAMQDAKKRRKRILPEDVERAVASDAGLVVAFSSAPELDVAVC